MGIFDMNLKPDTDNKNLLTVKFIKNSIYNLIYIKLNGTTVIFLENS
jgi:hypothetical protein